MERIFHQASMSATLAAKPTTVVTENGVVSVFGRLRERAGLTREEVGPTLIRDSFVVRYLQAGGDVFTLRDLLGQQESVAVKRYLRKSEQGAVENETRKVGVEGS